VYKNSEKMKTAGFIGGGRITRILLNGFKNANVSFTRISVHETSETVANALKFDFPQIETSGTDATEAASSDWVFIALHPPVVMETLQVIRDSVRKDALLVSLAPKITIGKIKSVLPDVPNLARMNPNAGTYVDKGYNPVCFAPDTDKNVIREFLDTFEKLGKVPVIPENHIEAYAMISAMGHTYFWYQLQQLKELALSYGLPENEADESISAMLWGTTETLFHSGLSYDKVVDLVPVKPMAEHEDAVREYYKTCLNGLYQKIKPVS
jgi:pyrroline-5-carboxylate reductase